MLDIKHFKLRKQKRC